MPPRPPSPLSPLDAATLLARQAPQQSTTVACYLLGDTQVWLKRAGPPNSPWPYRILGAVAHLFRAPVLRPVPNPGGTVTVATEVRRLRDLNARGLRVPEVLAAQPDAFLMRHLGDAGQDTPSIDTQIHRAVPQGAAAVLPLWQDGLRALLQVHDAGACLSQAFARNLVRCPDGVVGFIDFEDDPAAVLPLPVCQVRDVLCYAHSTAHFLRASGAMAQAQEWWAQQRAQRPAPLQQALRESVERMAFMRHLPQERKLGRDLQRVRAAYDLLAGR